MKFKTRIEDRYNSGEVEGWIDLDPSAVQYVKYHPGVRWNSESHTIGFKDGHTVLTLLSTDEADRLLTEVEKAKNPPPRFRSNSAN